MQTCGSFTQSCNTCFNYITRSADVGGRLGDDGIETRICMKLSLKRVWVSNVQGKTRSLFNE